MDTCINNNNILTIYKWPVSSVMDAIITGNASNHD